MHLSKSLFLLFTLVVSALHQSDAAAPVTCSEQAACIDITTTLKADTDICGLDGCEYEICFTITNAGSDCKGDGESWSHTCEKVDVNSDGCLGGELGFGDGKSTEIDGEMAGEDIIVTGYSQCQTVGPGQTAQFNFKDGNGCDDGPSGIFVFGDTSSGACAPSSSESCTGSGNIGKECEWLVTAPACPTPPSGVGGDPHFKTWTGDKYDFHGECDLMLLKNPEFSSGLGMDVHIRTKAWGRYSSIETAAVRIGEDTLEVQADGEETHHWINGVADAELPGALSGYPIEYSEVGRGRKKQRFYTISLDGDEKIVVNTIKKLVQVKFNNAAKDSFGTSVGLMGDFETGSRVARDGKTVIKKWDPFGQEWQVRSSDPSLFRLVDGPQHPDKCVMPLVTSKATKQRRLSESGVGEEEAANACARVTLDDRDECIFDVLATGDIEMVDIYETATAGAH